MSDKPRTDMHGSARETDADRQRQTSGSTQQQFSTNQYGNDQGGNDQGSNDQAGNDQGDAQQGALKPALQRARHALEEGVERQAQHLQERARNTGQQISQALGAAAQTLNSEQSWLAGPAQDLAQSVRRLTAQGLGSPSEMKARVTDFARRHPAWALAGAVAVGFAAARFLKTTSSSSDSDHHRFVDHDEEEEAGRAERPDAVSGAPSGERFYG